MSHSNQSLSLPNWGQWERSTGNFTQLLGTMSKGAVLHSLVVSGKWVKFVLCCSACPGCTAESGTESTNSPPHPPWRLPALRTAEQRAWVQAKSCLLLTDVTADSLTPLTQLTGIGRDSGGLLLHTHVTALCTEKGPVCWQRHSS